MVDSKQDFSVPPTELWAVSPKQIKKQVDQNIIRKDTIGSDPPTGIEVTRVTPNLPVDTQMLADAVDGLSTRFGNLIETPDKIPYAEGAMAQVFFLKDTSNDKRFVVKVELVHKIQNGTETTYQYPWERFGLGDRSDLNGIPSSFTPILQRREIHKSVAAKLQSAGIVTAKFYGGMIIPGKAHGETMPLYAELWEDPGGVPMEQENDLENLYNSPESTLPSFVLGLKNLSEQGYVYDIGNSVSHSQTGYPYSKNIFVTPDNKLVAVDFNMGFDLKKYGVIPEISPSELWKPHPRNSRHITSNLGTTTQMFKYMNDIHKREEKEHLNLSRLMRSSADEITQISADWEKKRFQQMRQERELIRYFAQLHLTALMHNTLVDIHGKSFWPKAP